MSTTRGRRQLATAQRSVPGGATGAAGRMGGTQTPGAEPFASMRIPRAHGLVGVGVGPNQPVTYAVGGPQLTHPLIDFSSVITWRLVFAVLAAAYITGFHITLPGGARLGLPRVR